jgi:hypothetical protein
MGLLNRIFNGMKNPGSRTTPRVRIAHLAYNQQLPLANHGWLSQDSGA